MTPFLMRPRAVGIAIIAAGFIVMVVAGIIVGVQRYEAALKQRALEQSWAPFEHMVDNFDFSTTSLAAYQKTISTADPELHAEQELKLAWAYDISGDYKTGVPIIKAVIADQRVSAQTRAFAFAFLNGAYHVNRSKEVLQFIFNDDGIYKEALGTGDMNSMPDLEAAMHRLLKVSDGLYPTSYIKYLLAFQAAGSLLDYPGIASTTRQAAIRDTAAYIAAGDALVANERSRSDYTYSLSRFFYSNGRHFRLYDLEAIARFDVQYRPEVDAAYQRIIRYNKANGDSGRFLGIEAYTRFYYAAYLADVFGAARANDIKDIIGPTIVSTGIRGTANARGVWLLYENELTRDKADRNHNGLFILTIAKLDSAFDEFLIAKGWKK